jgi:hypothetical protein
VIVTPHENVGTSADAGAEAPTINAATTRTNAIDDLTEELGRILMALAASNALRDPTQCDGSRSARLSE